MNDRGEGCLPSNTINSKIDLKEHWDNTYLSYPDKKLGWYETDLNSTLYLFSKSGLRKIARILIVGAGSTTLIDELLERGFSNLIASDLSEVALKRLKDRVKNGNVEFISDDLTDPIRLLNIAPVDLWIDRAVLHFFTETKDQETYFNLLKKKVKDDGFVLLAEFNLQGATKCSGLLVNRYSKEMLIQKLGIDFKLIESFDYTYITPSGAERPYVYTLFRKNVT